MKIAAVSYHACIRTIKESIALMEAGVDVHNIQHHYASPDMGTVLTSSSFYTNPEQLAQKLKMMDDIDLIHVHNEPSWLVTAAKEARPDLPVVFDVHDLASMQEPGFMWNSRLTHEASAMRDADGFIFPSRGYYDQVFQEYGLMKPRMVVYAMCNREVMMLPQLPRVGGVVYEGGVIAPQGSAHGSHGDDSSIHYRNHLKLSHFLTSSGIPFAVYGVGATAQKAYLFAGAQVFPSIPYYNMLSNLSRYDWGFVGAAEPNKAIETCMPNKMFEYIIMGVPVIVCNAPEAGEWAEKNGVGIHVKSIEEIPARYNEHIELRKNVADTRHKFVMESQVDSILEFYKSVTAYHENRRAKELKRLGVGV